ncbi:MAG: GC-type dockerin domain-anchored protein [Phycisphaerales bacterium]
MACADAPNDVFLGRVTVDYDVLAGYDGITSVYRGSCGSLTEILCTDEPEPAEIELLFQQGEHYYFQIGDWGTAPGGGQTAFSLFNQTVYNTRAYPGLITPNTAVGFDNSESQFDPDPPVGLCNAIGTTETQNAAWLQFDCPSDSLVLVRVVPQGYDAILGIYEPFTPNGLLYLACADDPEVIQFHAFAGHTYLFQVGEYGTTPGGGPTVVQLLDLTSCPCDMTPPDGFPNGVLDIDDIAYFAEYFVAGDTRADLNGNGVLNLDDIDAFATCFVAGCP